MKSFDERIYEKLKKVPNGKVITYKELAKAVNSNAYRAVGNAMKSNKDPINIPCYKVVCSNGFVGNYSGGGIKKKIELLKKDGIVVKNNKINLNKYLFKFNCRI